MPITTLSPFIGLCAGIGAIVIFLMATGLLLICLLLIDHFIDNIKEQRRKRNELR